jgi:hypothetical protein
MLLKNKQLKFEKKRAGRYIAKPSANILVEVLHQPESNNWYVGLLEITETFIDSRGVELSHKKEIEERLFKTKKEAVEWVTYVYLCEFGSI